MKKDRRRRQKVREKIKNAKVKKERQGDTTSQT
jgi:hypothetical protein